MDPVFPSNPQELLRSALRHHLQGRLAEAERLYREVLESIPSQPDALRLLGVLYRQRGQLGAARDLLERAVRVQPGSAEAHHDLGLIRFDEGQFSEAISAYHEALRLKPIFPDALYNLGNAYWVSGNRARAVEYFSKAIEHQPDLAEGHLNLGLLAYEAGKMGEAIRCYQTALRCRPDYAEAFFHLGIAAKDAGDFPLAGKALEEGLKLKPDDPLTLLNLGLVRQQENRRDEAEEAFKRLLAVDPAHHLAHLNLALLYEENGRLDEAVAECQTALALAPDDPESLTLMGALFKKQRRLDAAMSCFERALQVRPGFAPVLLHLAEISLSQGGLEAAAEFCQNLLAANPDHVDAVVYLGLIRSGQGRPSEAAALFQRALHLDPGQRVARLHLGVTQLLLGEYRSGFANYEARRDPARDSSKREEFRQPLWAGEELSGRTILLHAEQGLGDSIQFIRYARLVAERGGRVLVECDATLTSLFQNAEGVSAVIARGEPLPSFDVHLPFLSLARVFGTTLESVPNQVPYLRVPRGVSFNLPEAGSQTLKVGLVWAGNPQHANDTTRSMRLACLESIWSADGVAFFSLQIGPAREQLASVRGADRILDLSPQLKDFAVTAKAVSQLDLVISVDTAVVHLAGSLGKTVWLLLPYVNDWRWGLERETSPWYPTLRIFRQTKPEDWSAPVEEVARQLRAWAASHETPPPLAQSSERLAVRAIEPPDSFPVTCSIIIPVFNQIAYTEACLKALFQNTPSSLGIEVIVVDNGSTDGTSEFLRRECARQQCLKRISLSTNTGFSHACNRGAEASHGGYLLFLNNDTLPQTNWLAHLLAAASRPQVGAVGPKLLYPDTRTVNHAGYVYNETLRRFYPIYHRLDEDFHGVTKEREYQALLGACLLVQRAAFFAAGRFADYGGEDIDLCLKLRKRGLRMVYCPLSIVLHHGSVTLLNSPPGTIPPSGARDFCSRWPAESIVADDERFYREDGFCLRGITADGQIDLEECITASSEWVIKATQLRGAPVEGQVEGFFLKALSLYSHNVAALTGLLELYCREQRLHDAVRCAASLRRIEPGDFRACLRLAEILLASGDRERTAEVLEYLLRFPELPGEISQEIERRKATLRWLPNLAKDRSGSCAESVL